MNAIYLHPVDGFTFLENVPEKPNLCSMGVSPVNCADTIVDDDCQCTRLMKAYERTLAECIEKRMVIGNVPEYRFPQMKDGDLLPWLGTYSKDVFNTKVILSPPKEEKKPVFIREGHPFDTSAATKVFDTGNVDPFIKVSNNSEPVNSSMSEKEEKKLDYFGKIDALRKAGIIEMGLKVKSGDKVVGLFWDGQLMNGTESEQEEAEKYIQPDKEYTVESIEIGNWHSTVVLKEYPKKHFNTVHFGIKAEPCAYEEECQHPACNCGKMIIPFKKSEPVVSQDQESVVYAIYSGCKFEGGGVKALYKNRDDARKGAAEMAAKKQKDTELVHADDPDEGEEYRWLKIDDDSWENCIDEIRVLEYQVI